MNSAMYRHIIDSEANAEDSLRQIIGCVQSLCYWLVLKEGGRISWWWDDRLEAGGASLAFWVLSRVTSRRWSTKTPIGPKGHWDGTRQSVMPVDLWFQKAISHSRTGWTSVCLRLPSMTYCSRSHPGEGLSQTTDFSSRIYPDDDRWGRRVCCCCWGFLEACRYQFGMETWRNVIWDQRHLQACQVCSLVIPMAHKSHDSVREGLSFSPFAVGLECRCPLFEDLALKWRWGHEVFRRWDSPGPGVLLQSGTGFKGPGGQSPRSIFQWKKPGFLCIVLN